MEPAAAVAALCHYGGGGDSRAARWGSQHRVFRLHTAAQQRCWGCDVWWCRHADEIKLLTNLLMLGGATALGPWVRAS